MLDFIQKHNTGIKVKPRSKSSIAGLAGAFRRKVCKTEDTDCLDILKVLELVLPKLTGEEFEFFPLDNELMGDTEAAMSPDRMKMCIRQDVYDALHEGDLRARFTIAHELGHFVLHEGVALARGNAKDHKIYEDSEWQANCFAAELLAPINQCIDMTEDEIMEKFHISRQCAGFRFKEANRR